MSAAAMSQARAIDSPRRQEPEYFLAGLPAEKGPGDLHAVPPSRQDERGVSRLAARHHVGLLDLAVAVGLREIPHDPVDRR